MRLPVNYNLIIYGYFFIHSKFKIKQLEILDLNNNIIKSSKLL